MGSIIYFFVKIFFKLFFKCRVECESSFNFPSGVIIAPNHASYLDPPFVAASWRGKKLHFFAGNHLFQGWFLSKILTSVQSHPVVRGKERTAIHQAIDLLKKGNNIVVFPEGTRSKDGTLSELKSGVAYMSYKTGCPIIPCSIEGTYEAWPRGKKIPKLCRMPLVCRFGSPLYPEGEESKERKDELTKKLFAEIKRLSEKKS